MNKLFRQLMLSVLLLVAMGAPAWGQSRIATVDLRKLFDGYWKTKQAEGALKERQMDLEKEYKGLTDDFQKLKDDYQKLLAEANDQAVSASEREKRKQAADGKLKSMKETEDVVLQFRRQSAEQIAAQKRRMIDNIVSEIRTVVNARAKSGSYSLVFDTAAETANGTPAILFTSGENDLTTAVLEQLNAGAPVDTAKPAEKKKDEAKPGEKK